MAAPDSRLCRYAIYESGFAAFDINLYSSQLYPGGEDLSLQDNILPYSCRLWLDNAARTAPEWISSRRGEAVFPLHAADERIFPSHRRPCWKTSSYAVRPWCSLERFFYSNFKNPRTRSVRHLRERGWQYTIDYEYLAKLSEERDMSCIGGNQLRKPPNHCNPRRGPLHEFGHHLVSMS